MPLFRYLPNELVEALRTNKCALFIGAGFSRSLGFPTWQGLIELIRRRIRADLPPRDDGGLDQLSSLQLVQYFVDQAGRSRVALNAALNDVFSSRRAAYDSQHAALTRLPV